MTDQEKDKLQKPIMTEVVKKVKICFKKLASVLPNLEQKIFNDQGAVDGNPAWKPTSKAGLRLRYSAPRGKGSKAAFDSYASNAKALIDTGKLKRSFYVDETPSEHNDYVLVLATDLPYAKLLNDGGMITVRTKKGSKRCTLPPRKFLFMTKDMKAAVDNQFNIEFGVGGNNG